MERTIFALFLVFLISPAKAADSINRYPVRTDHLTDTDSGYVLASEARWESLYFLHVEGRQEYRSDGTFCGRLPVGHYELYKINTSYGAVTSDDPFTFEVVAGQRNYIGTVSPPWVSDSKKFAEQREKNPAVRKYDLSKFMKVAYDYTVFDQMTALGKKFQKRCKDVDISEFTTQLMK